MKTSSAVTPLLTTGLILALTLSGCAATPVEPELSSAAPSPSATASPTPAPFDLDSLPEAVWSSDIPGLSATSSAVTDSLAERVLTIDDFATCEVTADVPVYTNPSTTLAPVARLPRQNFLLDTQHITTISEDDTPGFRLTILPGRTGGFAGDSGAAIAQAYGYVVDDAGALTCQPAAALLTVDADTETATLTSATGGQTSTFPVRLGSEDAPTPRVVAAVAGAAVDPEEEFTTADGRFPIIFLTSHSTTLATYNDIDGRGRGLMSVHYWPEPAFSSTGTAACVGVGDEATMAELETVLTPGTPVVIR